MGYLREPGDLSDGPPPRRPPKSVAPPFYDSTGSDLRPARAEVGGTLPILYGTGRVVGNCIEMYGPKVANSGNVQWKPSTTYPFKQIVFANGASWQMSFIAGGTSAASGTGPGSGANDRTTQDVADGTCTWNYLFPGVSRAFVIGFCEGPIYAGGKAWQDKQLYASYTNLPTDVTFFLPTLSLGTGVGIGTRPSWLATPSPDLKYAYTAVLMLSSLTGADPTPPKITLEINGLFCGASVVDVSPADIAVDLLTNARRGVAWPSGRVDAVSTGTGAASYRTYCTAFGLNLSWLIDKQTHAIELLRQLLDATNTDAIWTNRLDGLGCMLKFVPLGDQPLTANGVTYTPNTTATPLTEADYLEPLQVIRVPPDSTYNSFPVEYVDRAQDYGRVVVDDPDMADVDQRGLRRAPTIALPQVLSPTAAIMLSRIRAQRSLNVRNMYTFKLSARWLLTEPGDLFTLSDGVLGFSGVPVRVIAVEEDLSGDGATIVTAEDWPAAVSAATGYAPQAGDGYKPASATSIATIQVLPSQVPQGTVPDSSSTRGANVDNLWPNAGSEMNPPDGADTTTAEWAGRVNAGAGAYAGSWVRQLSAALGSRQILGDTTPVIGAEPATQSRLAMRIPCSPGESFYIEAWCKATAGVAADTVGVYLWYVDANGNALTATTTFTTIAANISTWTKCIAYATAPAGTVAVRFGCYANNVNGATTAQFDAIYARRQIDPRVLGLMGGYLVDEIQTAALKSIGRLTSGSGPTTTVDRAWYRGNSDLAALNGAPNAFRLTVTPMTWDQTNNRSRFEFKLQPTGPSDNLDAMRYAKVVLFWTNGAQLTNIGTWYVPIVDRLYKTPGTDSDAGNANITTYTFFPDGSGLAGIAQVPACQVTLYNANGASETHCFYPGNPYTAWTAGTPLIDNGTSWPPGAPYTGGPPGAPAAGGGAGGGCLDPETPVLLRPGLLVPLRTLRDGDTIWTRPEEGGEMGFYRVERVTHTSNLRCRVTMKDGRGFTCSINHRLNVRGLWRRADSLMPGEEVQGDPGGHVRGVEYLGEGPVVQLSIPTAKTYFAGDGCWHHNYLKP
jgi:hypothetical protein